MNTIFLSPTPWDLVADLNGNIAMAQAPYAVAQDVASACRLWLGELWYNTSVGVPYAGQILGEAPSQTFVAAQLQAAALTVPTVASAKVAITSYASRRVSGQVQFTTSTEGTQIVGF